MQLTCPVCGHRQSRAHQAWRLELCPRCQSSGREAYLSEAAAEPRDGRVSPRPLRSFARVASRVGRPAA